MAERLADRAESPVREPRQRFLTLAAVERRMVPDLQRKPQQKPKKVLLLTAPEIYQG